MDVPITNFLQTIYDEISSWDLVNWFLESIVDNALYPEKHINSLIDNVVNFFTGGEHWVLGLYATILGIGFALILLKFLRKGFDVFILQAGGDPESDPLDLVVNFAKAIAIAVAFPMLYDLLAQATQEISDLVLSAIHINWLDIPVSLFGAVIFVPGGVIMALVSVIYLILFLWFMLTLMGRGLEVLVMRLGMPLACIGLIDSDKGVFAPYMKRFFQNALTIIVQLALFKLSIVIMTKGHPWWALAAIMMTLKTPRFLQEFMIMYGYTPPSSVAHMAQTVVGNVRMVASGLNRTAGDTGAAATAANIPAPPPPPPV